MTDRIQQQASGAAPVGRDTLVVRARTAPTGGAAFADVLAQQLGADGIKLSAHAQKRLRETDVPVDPARLTNAVSRAEQKGSSESLILLDDLAFVVSVKNRTVITAVDKDRAKENVFTNIDSVVIG